jgi:hypothetical protein
VTEAPGPDTGGPLMFVRYAYPPNALGYCGPANFAAFREYAVAGVVDRLVNHRVEHPGTVAVLG